MDAFKGLNSLYLLVHADLIAVSEAIDDRFAHVGNLNVFRLLLLVNSTVMTFCGSCMSEGLFDRLAPDHATPTNPRR
jgi:hypothetical protein